jgi:hypothetical protein
LGYYSAAETSNGFAFDVKRAGLLFAEIRAKQEELKEKIYARFPPILTCVREFRNAYKRDGSLLQTISNTKNDIPNLRRRRRRISSF